MLFEPTENVIVEGLLPLHTKFMRACFDVSVYLDPPRRSVGSGRCLATPGPGYTKAQVLAELVTREPESEEFIRAQRRWADIVVQFAPIEGRDERGRVHCRRRCCCARPRCSGPELGSSSKTPRPSTSR